LVVGVILIGVGHLLQLLVLVPKIVALILCITVDVLILSEVLHASIHLLPAILTPLVSHEYSGVVGVVVQGIMGEILLFVDLTRGLGVSGFFCLTPPVAGPTVRAKVHACLHNVRLIAS